MKITLDDIVKESQKSPIFFIKAMWGLNPQPVKDEYKDEVNKLLEEKEPLKSKYFEKFIKGEHITWQQWLVLLGIEKALRKEGAKRLSIASGHGIGKSCVLSWLLIWYLFCFKQSQIPCTAPTSEQMNDVLWKEVAKWIIKLPEGIKEKFEWTTTHIRISESPETWFARAKTARKEAPEALAGMHGDYVMMLIDEASGVPEEIFNTAEGALTEENTLVVMISNPTRTIGYFYDSHHRDKKNWQTFQFSSIESPLPSDEYTNRIVEKHGENSDEYKIRVLGLFPDLNTMDDSGYVPLLMVNDIVQTIDANFVGILAMGIDPAGEGKNETAWVVRDSFKAKLVVKEPISNEKSIAQKTLTLMDYYGITQENVFVDNFGTGANVGKELALCGVSVQSLNVGMKADDPSMYINKRAEAYHLMKQWLRTGGELLQHKDWEQLLKIMYRKETSGKMKIMSKLEMKKKYGFESPDVADALMLTFTRKYLASKKIKQKPYVPNCEHTGY